MTTPGSDATVPDDTLSTAPSSAGKTSRRADPALQTLTTELLDFFSSRGSEPASQNFIIDKVTKTYLGASDSLGELNPQIVEQHLLTLGNIITRSESQKLPKGDKYPPLRRLSPWQVTQVVLHLHRVIRIAPNAKDTDREYDLLAMYRPTGTARGTYTTSEDDIRMAARAYNPALTLNEFKEVLAVLKEEAPRTHQNTERDLIAVNNGIFYYGHDDLDLEVNDKKFHFTPKTLHPFDPALIYLAKSHVDYVPQAPKPVITHPEDGTTWDIESWIASFFDAPEQLGLTELIWEIIGAIVRPHVRWGKTAWLYSEQGNNGKGTLCALMRNLIGTGSHTSIPLSDFGKDFALEPLVRASAIIVDENDVGTFIDKAANLKAIVTNDVIQINRKFRMPIAYQFFGFMVQCLNEFPQVKDKSESFYRRQLFVPFTKSFTGAERKYIKDDYLQRREVLEYTLWYVLHVAGAQNPGNYYTLSEPVATHIVLAEYKEANDPVRAFWEEFRSRFVWDLLPFPFLYDLYKVWFVDVSPSGTPVSRQRFVADLAQIVLKDEEFACPDKTRKIRPALMMDQPELLIHEFGLKNWFNDAEKTAKNPDPAKLSRPALAPNYRGILRRVAGGPVTGGNADDDTADLAKEG